MEIRRSLGPHLAAASIPRRRILLDREVLHRSGDFERILIHELFHFVWVRLSNERRRSWEQIIRAEIQAGARGELGWSAEWRKLKLSRADAARRTVKWRHYACESFCDSAAWLFSGIAGHEEFTLPAAYRKLRRDWFRRAFPATSAIPV